MRAIASLLLAGALAFISAGAADTSLVCSLTGKEIKSCCCEQRNGKLYCTLAKKEINDCCCHSKK